LGEVKQKRSRKRVQALKQVSGSCSMGKRPNLRQGGKKNNPSLEKLILQRNLNGKLQNHRIRKKRLRTKHQKREWGKKSWVG